jgi:hypothetical protein
MGLLNIGDKVNDMGQMVQPTKKLMAVTLTGLMINSRGKTDPLFFVRMDSQLIISITKNSSC